MYSYFFSKPDVSTDLAALEPDRLSPFSNSDANVGKSSELEFAAERFANGFVANGADAPVNGKPGRF